MPLKIGIVRDDAFLEHMPGQTHPEHPSRLRAVYRMLDGDFTDRFDTIEPQPATLEALELVHTKTYIQKVLKTADHKFTSLAPDTPVSARSYRAAWLAVGGCLKALESLAIEDCDVCFALVRPPGHHALPDRAAGFCIFNNLGITARRAASYFGFERILIIDWDTHHGNGIQDIFYDQNTVLYFSTHDKLLYPYSGDWEETGTGAGSGYTVNVPVPRDLDGKDFVHLYRELLTRIVKSYEPDLICVAAGFDAHHEDPIGRSQLTAPVFAELTALILELRGMAQGPPILMALEGGYSSSGLAASVKNVFGVLAGDESFVKSTAEYTPASVQLIEKAIKTHRAHNVWTT